MSTTAVGYCSHCAAIINRHWSSCLVCHAPVVARPPAENLSRVYQERVDTSTVGPSRPVIEPAPPNPRPIYWETGDGRILGPAVPEFFLQDGEEYWISVTFEGHIRFLRDDRLRSRKAFEQQAKVRAVEPIPKDGF